MRKTKCQIIETDDDEAPRSPRRASPPTTAPVQDILRWPVLVYNDDIGGMCVTFRREVFPNATNSPRQRDAEQRWLELIAIYDVCPGVERPVVSPAAIARQVVEEFIPAPPAPEIAPGYAITGKTAYLETHGNLRPASDQRATQLGQIEVTFHGTYVVDWGDGTPAESFDVEGEAWPNGRITHVYTTVGRYDVVVTAQWVADWRIGSTTGRIDTNLASVGRIDDFEVRQLQAVRDS